MILNTNSLKNNEMLQSKFTCDGEKLFPDLNWSNFPTETKSFALILEDPDAINGNFIHFLAINIPVNITLIKHGETKSPGTSIINDGDTTSYVLPCPPEGTGKHRYIFKIFALNINQVDGVNKDNFFEKIKVNVIDQAEIITYYQRI